MPLRRHGEPWTIDAQPYVADKAREETLVEQYPDDLWRAPALADAAVERAAQELRGILEALARSLDPFPSFLGMPTLQAVEVEPGGVAKPERGCVVVGPDGELYGLTLRMIPGPPEAGGTDQVEELKELELEPGEYVSYAYRAIQELVRIHHQRQQGPST